MQRFMLVMKTDRGTQITQFYDDYNSALDAYSICAVSLGWFCELYSYGKLSDDDGTKGYTKLM